MVWKILKYSALGVACLIGATLAGALSYRAWLQHQVAQRRAIRSPPGIQSLERIRIGGIDQWIEVRARDAAHPILLFLHGGPGVAFIPFAGSFQDAWETNFTVVQWDQRGAGKTYASNDKELQHRTMTIAQMEQDALDVTNYLRARFHRDKIFVLGHSWGSILGLWLAHEHPDLIYAYVGVGQVVDSQRNEEAAYQDALREARTHHRVLAIQALEALAPYPGPAPDSRKVPIAHGWEEFLLGRPAGPREFLNIRRLLLDLLSAPEYSLVDDYHFIRGQRNSLQIFIPQLAKVNVRQLGLEFHAPVFFFQGTLDAATRPALVREYAGSIRAPYKAYVPFDGAGHFPFFEDPANFAGELARRVLPFAR